MRLIFPLLGLPLLWGQRSKVTSAALAVQDGDFEQALKYIREALAAPQLLKTQDLAKAHKIRAQAYMALLVNSRDPGSVLNRYPSLFEETMQSLRQCRQYDEAKKFEPELRQISAQAVNMLFREGVELFRNGKLPEARQYFTWAIEACEYAGQKDFYPPYGLRGIVELQLRDTQAALKDLEIARQLALSLKKPLPNDQILPFVYSSLITSYGAIGQAQKALEIVAEARTKFPTDENIRRAELNLYLQNPQLQSQALERFRQEIEREPRNETYLLIYAQLWEKVNPDSAVYYYQKVLEINPDNLNANYNLGAHYVNQGAEMAYKHNESRDEKTQQRYFAKMQEYFRLALPYLEKAYAQLNDDLGLIQSLIQVTTYLGMEDKAKEYLRRKNELQQKRE
ncbi:MAG: hypothetical protein NZ958_03445 [Bacteroidia bacterium]|nr:hypothetical protein [Bacteroidia bacterium]MDW8088273.1 hypothetical protein [Bacteroidia bacterium]